MFWKTTFVILLLVVIVLTGQQHLLPVLYEVLGSSFGLAA
jgi:hypothetical protein